jgi:hypothetical protein
MNTGQGPSRGTFFLSAGSNMKYSLRPCARDDVLLDQQSDVIIVFWAYLKLQSCELDTELLSLS